MVRALAYLVVTGVAGAASLAVTAAASRRRHVPGVRYLAAMMAGAAIWCVAVLGEVMSSTLAGTAFWAQLEYLGVATVPPSWLLFSLTFTGRLSPESRSWIAAAYAVPVVTIVLVFLSPDVPLLWSSIDATANDVRGPLAVEHGPWFWVQATYAYACLGVGSVVLLTTVLRRSPTLTGRMVLIVIAVALPWLANLLSILRLVPLEGYDLTPPAIALSGLLVGVGLVRLRILDTHPGLVTAARDAVIESMRDGVLVLDVRGRILSTNTVALELLGDKEAVVGHDLEYLLERQPRDTGRPPSLADMVQRGALEVTVSDRAGMTRFIELLAAPLTADSRTAGYVVTLRDVSERRHLEDKLRHRALHDGLTELPNRMLLHEHIEKLLALRRRRSGQLALLIIDLDNFKHVNDTYGHETGDKLLRAMGQRLAEAVRGSDVVARLGGDEFSVILPDCGAEDAVDLAMKLRDRLVEDVDLEPPRVAVSSSIGVAVSPTHGEDAGTLLRHADVALYQAKGSSQGVSMYCAESDPNSPEQLQLIKDLRTAVAVGALTLHYQPLLDLTTERVHRLEALVRWPLSDGTLLPAGDFIPMAEQNGLVSEITAWVLMKALRQRRAWANAGMELDVALNLSAIDLRDSALVDRVTRILRDCRVAPQHLWLEVTETAVMSDPKRARRVLASLSGIGVHLAIDDFGVGHSSLHYVRTLPAGDLKIDRSFVQHMDVEPRDAAIVRAAVSLAHDLSLTVTAEGIEDEAVLACAREIGCDHAQGRYIAEPMPADEVLDWILTRTETASG